MLNKESKRLLTQMLKFVYLFSKSSLSALKMLYKHYAGTDDIRIQYFELQTICYKYKHET
jgi:hypothetical protein